MVTYFSANHKTLLLSGQQHIKEVTIWGAQVSNLLFNLICFSDLALTSSFADYLALISILRILFFYLSYSLEYGLDRSL